MQLPREWFCGNETRYRESSTVASVCQVLFRLTLGILTSFARPMALQGSFHPKPADRWFLGLCRWSPTASPTSLGDQSLQSSSQ